MREAEGMYERGGHGLWYLSYGETCESETNYFTSLEPPTQRLPRWPRRLCFCAQQVMSPSLGSIVLCFRIHNDHTTRCVSRTLRLWLSPTLREEHVARHREGFVQGGELRAITNSGPSAFWKDDVAQLLKHTDTSGHTCSWQSSSYERRGHSRFKTISESSLDAPLSPHEAELPWQSDTITCAGGCLLYYRTMLAFSRCTLLTFGSLSNTCVLPNVLNSMCGVGQ
ncbi:hypothetical protein BC629DRAFT_647752 [Irpex lacteus]|nr:hypothetical protein BC629DRAFT_647752 [Irpex lacteus]